MVNLFIDVIKIDDACFKFNGSDVEVTLITENSESVVQSDDQELPGGSEHTSVVGISGSDLKCFSVNEDDDRK